jgi:NitT/TauT family transport system ATP-binding protein
MRSRVQLARALYREPDVLFLDEPFSGLDERLRYQLNALVKGLKGRYGFSALVVSHSIEEAVFLSDRILVLLQAPNGFPVSVEELREGLEFSSRSLDVLEAPEFRRMVARVRDVLFRDSS